MNAPYSGKERAVLFYVGCLPFRFLVTVTAFLLAFSEHTRPWAWGMGVWCLERSVQFAKIAVLGKDVGDFGGFAFWRTVRPLHALLWLGAAISLVACTLSNQSWVSWLVLAFLATDTAFALLFSSHYYAFGSRDASVRGCCPIAALYADPEDEEEAAAERTSLDPTVASGR